MNDERLLRRLAAHAGPAEIDPGFEDLLYALLQREMRRREQSAWPALLLVAALLAILMISAAIAVGSGLVKLPGLDESPTPSPSAAASEQSELAPTLLQTAAYRRSSYPAGQYWWHMRSALGMHNPTSVSEGATITISTSAASEGGPGATAIAVAGHDGTYRLEPTDADGVRTEVWTADIEGTHVVITLFAEPDVTEAELAEAHAIVDSIHAERWDNPVGFRLIFTLPAGWDSY